MFYATQPTLTSQWPSTVQYQSYTHDRCVKILWLLGLATLSITLSVAALVIVFVVEHSWFYDTFNYPNVPNNQNISNKYGLWRLCIFPNQTCADWFSDKSLSYYVELRLSQAKVGINAWQALEIVFIFLTTSSLIVTLAAVIAYRSRKIIHYYLAVLAAFCIWPAACVGISGLFVFGFSVYNVATDPRGLDWCFYVNIAAVALSFIGAILLTIYGICLKRPTKTHRDPVVMPPFSDFNLYPGNLNQSPFVLVKRKKTKRKKPFDYPEAFYPNKYYSSGVMNNGLNADFVSNPNHQALAPYTSTIPNQQINPPVHHQQPPVPRKPQREQLPIQYRTPDLLISPSKTSIPGQLWHSQPPVSSYSHEPPHWHRTETNPINYNSPPKNNYIQHGIYRPNRVNQTGLEQREEPRVLHYYTGYDHFSSIDPRETAVPNYNPSLRGPTSSVQYPPVSSYYSKDY